MKKLLFSISIIYSIFAFSEEEKNHFCPDDKAIENSSSIIVQNNYNNSQQILHRLLFGLRIFHQDFRLDGQAQVPILLVE